MPSIRAAAPGDREALSDLKRRILPPTSVVLRYEYPSGPEAFLSLQGSESVVWIAEEKGRILGSIAESVSRAVFDEKEGFVYYLGGLQVDPAASASAGFSLMIRARKSFEDRGCGLGIALVQDGNRPALEFVETFTRRRYQVLRAGGVVLHVILPFPVRSLSGRSAVRSARAEDIPEIVRLLAASPGRHYGRPPYSFSWLSELLARTPGLSIEDFKVAEAGGRIVAAAAFWDQRTVRGMKVAGLDRTGRMKGRVWSALARLGGGRGPELKGGIMPVAYMRFPAVEPGRTDALRDILRDRIRDKDFRKRYAAIFAGFHERDPMADCLRGLARMSVRSTLLLTIPKTDPLLTPENYDPARPYDIDMSLV